MLMPFMAACCGQAYAETFDSDGLNFEITGEDRCRVTASANAAGNVVVPESVYYNDNTYTVVEIGEMAFANCTMLETVHMPATVTTIGAKAFLSCRSLKTIEISDNVTTTGSEAFRGCTGLTDIRLGSNMTTTGNYLFMGCTSINAIDIPAGFKSIPAGCFYGCTSLISATLPETLETIGEEAFAECTSLIRASLPSSLLTVGRKSFFGCTALKAITIGAQLTSIGTQAFDACEAVENVYSHAANPPAVEMYPFDDDIYGKATLTVPTGSIAAYRNTFPYQEFSAIVEDDNPENHVKLAIRFPQKGAIVTDENFGARVTLKISADEGWSIAGISLNGEDCIESISESGYLTTPQLFSDSELDIIFAKSGGIDKISANNAKIRIYRDTISIEGCGENDLVRIYSISDCKLLHEGKNKTFRFIRHGVFLLTVSGHTFKFAM